MSIVYMIKCIQCKSEFDQGDTTKRICPTCVSNRARYRVIIDSEKKKELRKIMKPDFYEKKCKSCDTIFKTKIANKQFCNNYCVKQYARYPNMLPNIEKNIIRIEERIQEANEKAEQRIMKIEEDLDKINYQFEAQRLAYVTKREFLLTRQNIK